MSNLVIGVGQVSLYIRYAQTLKDKQQLLRPLRNKLEKLGFSVSEFEYQDDPKQGSLGFSYAGRNHAEVEEVLREALNLFFGNYEVVQKNKDIFVYEGEPVETERDDRKYGYVD